MTSHDTVAAVALALTLALVASSCSNDREEAQKRITPEYDANGKLQLLKYDSKGNGHVDTWSYMNGARVVRIEMDQDGDGTIDRWEYYDPEQRLEKIGLSRLNDGKVDAWSFTGPDGAIARTEVSTHRDGTIDRIEYYEHDVMVRAEEDGDGDGRPDKWETYADARLTSVAFDTLHRGVPDRRLNYHLDGATSMDVDPEGDGHLLPTAAKTLASRRANSR